MATTTKSEIRGWTTYGDIRGQCGHLHKSRKAAQDCADRDQRGCASQRGYSDRDVHAVDADGYLTYDDGNHVPNIGGRTSGALKFSRD